MTKEDLFFYISTKKELEFKYNNKTYNLTYGNDSKGDYISFGLLYEEKRYYSWGELINEAKIDNHFFKEMLDIIN
ncbi:MAG: hypothetical protein MJ188_02460 [Treponema sp.]|nr:hypothetical protein [Treponema sp.]